MDDSCSNNRRKSALLLVGSRQLNKRMCLFAEGLLESEFEVSIFAPPRGRWRWSRGETDAPQAAMTPGRFLLRSANARRFARPNLVVCFHWALLPLAVILQCVPGVRVAYDEYDFYELNTLEGEGSTFRRHVYRQLIRLLHWCCLPFMDMITCIHLAKGFLKHRLKRRNDNVLELHNYPTRHWLDAKRRAGAIPAQQNERPVCFVFVGGIWEVKGCRVVADAFARLNENSQKQTPSVELHFFGSGDPELTAWLKARPNINVHGESTPATMREFLVTNRCAGLMLYQTGPRYRLLGTNSRKMYEYLATGSALIATATGEVTRFVKSNDVGYLIPPDGDAEQLVHVFQEILTNLNAFDQKCANALQLMEQPSMNWEAQWQRALDCGLLDGHVRETFRIHSQDEFPATQSAPPTRRKAA